METVEPAGEESWRDTPTCLIRSIAVVAEGWLPPE